MFSHVMVGTNDLDRAKAFYDQLLGALGARPGLVERHRVFYLHAGGIFAVSLPIDGEPATVANGATIGFTCASPEQADAWHAACLSSGGTSIDEPPCVREGPAGKLYLAYLRVLDGNKLCGMCRKR